MKNYCMDRPLQLNWMFLGGVVFAVVLSLCPNDLEAQQCNVWGSGGLTLTPCNTNRSVHIGQADTVNIVIKNRNKYESVSFNTSCGVSGTISSCSVSPTSVVIPKEGQKTVTLISTASMTHGTGKTVLLGLEDTIFYTVPHVQDIVISPNVNRTDGMIEMCAVSCFSSNASISTAPFYTMDTPRSVQLVYVGERVNPKPVIYADVSIAQFSDVPVKYSFEATLDGTAITFLNGDTKIYYSSGGGQPVRLGGQFDASAYATGVYPLNVTVTTTFADSMTKVRSYSKHLIIVNELKSPIAKGWTVVGVQRMYFPAMGGYLITDGGGSAVYFPYLDNWAEDFSRLQYDTVTGQYERIYLDGAKVIFDSVGYASSVINPLGHTTSISYDISHRISTIKEPLRVSLGGGGSSPYFSFIYGPRGLATVSEMGGGGPSRVTTFTLGSDSTLQVVKDPDGDSSRYTYDIQKRISTSVNRNGGITTYTYDSNSGKLVRVDLPQIAVDAGVGNTVNKNPKILYTPWQTLGIPTTTTTSVSPATPILQSNIQGEVKDPIGRTTKFTVNSWGQPLVITDSEDRTTTINRRNYLPTRIVYPNGGVDSMVYEIFFPLLTYFRSAGDSVIQFRYNSEHRVDSVWGSAVIPQRLFLDSVTGRVDSIRTASADSTKIRYTYDNLNRIITVVDAGKHVTNYRYESNFGNRDSSISPGNIVSIRRFDSYGRDSALWASGKTYWTHIAYDLINRPLKTWNAGVSNDTIFTFYNASFPIRTTMPGGGVHKYEFNSLGWITKQYDTKDTTLFLSYRYDTVGRMTSMTNRRGHRIDMKYDMQDRLLVRSGTNVPTDSFTYSSNQLVTFGRRVGGSDDSLIVNINGTPDKSIHKIDGHRFVFQYSYSLTATQIRQALTISSNTGINFSNVTRVIQPGATTRDSMYVTGGAGSGGTQFSINPDGVLFSTSWPQGGATNPRISYHTATHRQYWANFNYGVLADSLNRGVTYDSLGRIVFDVRHTSPTAYNITRTYTYDGLGQLLKVVKEKSYICSASQDTILGNKYICGSGVKTTQDSSTYDVAGNRIVSGSSYSTTGNRLLSWPGYSYTYDADGNMVTRSHNGVTDSLFWNAMNQLDSVHSGSLKTAYQYDAFGRLIRRKRNGTTDRYFLWNGMNLVAEISGSGTSRIAQYVHRGGTDQSFAIITDSAGTSLVRYFAVDLQGNVMGIMRNLSLSQYSIYSAWGKLEQRGPNTLADTNRLGWKGLMYEGDSTKLYYVRNRWYDPEIGRFISEDPIGLEGGFNLYTLAGNDPINGWDPMGLSADDSTHVLEPVGVTGIGPVILNTGLGFRDWEMAYRWWNSFSRGPTSIIPISFGKHQNAGPKPVKYSKTDVPGQKKEAAEKKTSCSWSVLLENAKSGAKYGAIIGTVSGTIEGAAVGAGGGSLIGGAVGAVLGLPAGPVAAIVGAAGIGTVGGVAGAAAGGWLGAHVGFYSGTVLGATSTVPATAIACIIGD